MIGRRVWPLLLPIIFISTASALGEAPGAYVIEPPDVLRIVVNHAPAGDDQPAVIDVDVAVNLAGAVSLGEFGTATLAGLTVDQARLAIARQVMLQSRTGSRLRSRLEVVASRSKRFYLIVEGRDGDRIHPLPVPVSGQVTVASAIGQVAGLTAAAEAGRVWIVRPRGGLQAQQLAVDWWAIVDGQSATDHTLQPGDRVYIGGALPK